MYCRKVYANITRTLVFFSIGVAVLTTIACSLTSFRDNTASDLIHQFNRDKKEPFVSIEEDFMASLCKAIKGKKYKKLTELLKKHLEEVRCLNVPLSDGMVELITGCRGHAKNKKEKEYINKALLVQVITSDEIGSEKKKDLLRILIEILVAYGYNLYKIFSQQYGTDKNTILHLAVSTADSDLVVWLMESYLACYSFSNITRSKFKNIFTIPNKDNLSPLLMLADAFYKPLNCVYRKPSADCPCDGCVGGIDIKMSQAEIMQYLLHLGAPFYKSMYQEGDNTTCHQSVLHGSIRYGSVRLFEETVFGGIMLEEMMQSIVNNRINKDRLVYLLGVLEEGLSLLSLAVINRNYEAVKYLVELDTCSNAGPGLCPLKPDGKHISPLFYALAYADASMVALLLKKSPCILQRRCSINKPGKHNITAIRLAQSPWAAGIRTALLAFCKKASSKYQQEILPDGWNWDPKEEIIKLLVDLGASCVTRIQRPLPSYGMLKSARFFPCKRKSIDSGYDSVDSEYNFILPDNDCKKIKKFLLLASPIATPSPTLAPSPFGA